MDDIITGAAAIGRAVGLSRRRVYTEAAAGRLPVFRLGATLCAKRSSLTAWLASCDGVTAATPRPAEHVGASHAA